MGAPEPLLDVISALPEMATDAAADEAAEHNAEWLERIFGLTGGPQLDDLPPPSVDALLADSGSRKLHAGLPAQLSGSCLVALDRLSLDGFQARQSLDSDATARLAASIAEQGVLQPLLVRSHGDDFQIVAGARRYHAAKLVGLREVPVVVLALTDRNALMIALVENLQREDINALDEAYCYFRLLDEFAWTQDELARHVGRSRSHIGNTLRLLGLPAGVKALLEKGELTAGHARALLNAPNPLELASLVVAQGLSVRATEALVRRRTMTPQPRVQQLDNELGELERELAERLGLTVRLRATRQGGKITIYYDSPDELHAALRAYGRDDLAVAPDDADAEALAAMPS
jgi:ParB family transcriptional regulator, chromosome partitioning protein